MFHHLEQTKKNICEEVLPPIQGDTSTSSGKPKVDANYLERISSTWIKNYNDAMNEFEALSDFGGDENKTSVERIENYIISLNKDYVVTEDHGISVSDENCDPTSGCNGELPYIAFREADFISLRAMANRNKDNKKLNQYMQSCDAMRLSTTYRRKGGFLTSFSQRDSAFMVTVGFNDRASAKAVASGSRQFIDCLNESIWPNDIGGNFLSGYAVLEPHVRKKGYVGCLHVHFVIDRNPAVVSDEFLLKKVLDVIPRILSKRKTKSHPIGRPLISAKSVDVRPVTDKRRLAFYVTKCINSRRWGRVENVMFLGREGLAGPNDRTAIKELDY